MLDLLVTCDSLVTNGSPIDGSLETMTSWDVEGWSFGPLGWISGGSRFVATTVYKAGLFIMAIGAMFVSTRGL